MRLHATAIALGAALLLAAPGAAREALVVGGVSSGAYVYSGSRHESIFFEGVDHDARVELAGLLGYEHARASYDCAIGLYAGAVVSSRTSSFRTVIGRLSLVQTWRASRRIELGASLTGDVEPLTTSQFSSAGVSQSIGRQTLTLRPRLDAELALGRADRLIATARGQLFYLLVDYSSLQDEEIDTVGSAQLDLEWEHVLRRARALRARVFGRIMKGRAVVDPPPTGLVGGMAGATLRWWDERLTLRAMAGAGRLVNLSPSHLWPVEPLFEAELAYTGRVDTFSVDGSWTIRENIYVAGLPERAIRAHVAWVRIPSWRRVRGVAEASYEVMRYTPMNVAAGLRRADRLQALRARGRLFLTVHGPWRLFGELVGSVGWLSLDQPSCDPPGCPATGLYLRTLIGVAYLHAERPRDERLLADVW